MRYMSAMSIRRPQVAHVVPALFGPGGVVGGAERYAQELARHMALRTPTRLITFGECDSAHRTGALDIRVLGNPILVRGQASNPFSFRLMAALRGADVVHCHQTHVAASSFAALLCRVSRRRVFTTDLGGGGWDISRYVSTDAWFHGHLHISKYSLRVSGHQRRRNASVISGGVDADRFAPDSAVARDGTVVFVGRILPHKGIDDLIDAMPDDLPLEIIGQVIDKPYVAALQALARGKQVRFRFDADDAAVIDAYRRAACVVLPSVYRTRDGRESRVPELLGQTLLEGMACEAPAICTDVASLPEVVAHGLTGLVVPPGEPSKLGDAIRWMVHHRGEARDMGRRARVRVVEHFTWPAVVERCLAKYVA